MASIHAPGSAAPFDALAASYGEQWSTSENGIAQRRQVWKQIDALFRPGEHVLDLGCGIGDDAVHLSERGVQTTGIDGAPKMVEMARARGVNALHLDLTAIRGSHLGPFDGIVSNFGALNCAANLAGVAEELSELLHPGGLAAICVLSRFYLSEFARFALAGDFTGATRRWSGQTQWRAITVHYRNRWEMARAFAPHFILIRRVSIGGGDHQLYIFRKSERIGAQKAAQ
jgi:SAM-dependent methyltransferase